MSLSDKISDYFYNYIKPEEIESLNLSYEILIKKIGEYLYPSSENTIQFGSINETNNYISNLVNNNFSEYYSGLKKSLAAFAISFVAIAYQDTYQTDLTSVQNYISSMDVGSLFREAKDVLSTVIFNNKSVLIPSSAFSMLAAMRNFSILSEMNDTKLKSDYAVNLAK